MNTVTKNQEVNKAYGEVNEYINKVLGLIEKAKCQLKKHSGLRKKQ